MTTTPNIAIAGATGAVGREMLAILEQRGFPHERVRLLASERSAGSKLTYRGQEHTVEMLDEHAFDGVDIALFSAGSGAAKAFAPVAVEAGAVVIDNSSAFRMDPNVALCVPEVNPDSLRLGADEGPMTPRIIANPNCSAVILLVGTNAVRERFGVTSMIVSTYQAASGAGAPGMEELERLTRDDLDGKPLTPSFFAEPYAFNLFSHDSDVDPSTGLNVEEEKVIEEARKIWDDPTLRISVTCIRVPVRRAHAESVHLRLETPASVADIRGALESAPGVRLVDDRASNNFPTPLKASGSDEVLVGRVRPAYVALEDGASPDGPAPAIDLFLCGDQLRKGAALNAVQIAEVLVKGT